MTLRDVLGRRFARVATNLVTREPRLWRLFRPLVSRQFGSLAREWELRLQPDHLQPLERALEGLEHSPRRVLDLGTGTGRAAVAVARRYPEAEVVGVDLAAEMIGEAQRALPEDLRGRVTYEVGDAANLRFGDATFDLVTLANMIPFFDELARVVAPGGAAVFSFSGGAGTPIFVSSERLRAELERRGFADFADFEAGRGTALLAVKAREA